MKSILIVDLSLGLELRLSLGLGLEFGLTNFVL